MVAKVLGLSAGGLIGAGLAAYLFSKVKLDLDLGPRREDIRAKRNPIKSVTLNISLDEVEEETRQLIAETLAKHESFVSRWSLSGWTPWTGTFFSNDSTKSSVGYGVYGLSNPDSQTKVLQLWAFQSGPGIKSPSFDWRRQPATEIIRGFSTLSPAIRLSFDFPDGSMLAIDLSHTGTELKDEFFGSGEMHVAHFYKVGATHAGPGPYTLNNEIYLKIPMQQASASTLGNIIL